MNAPSTVLMQVVSAAARSLPRTGSAWAVVAVLAIGMASALCGVAAQYGITRMAVAPAHAPLSIVGRVPVSLDEGSEVGNSGGLEPGPLSLADYAAWREDPALERLEVAERIVGIVELGAAAERIVVWNATPGLFAWLAIDEPIVGRLPEPVTPEALAAGTPMELALSASAVGRWFERAEQAVGQIGTIDGASAVVVGVVPDPPGDAFAGIQAWTAFDPIAQITRLSRDGDLTVLSTPMLTGVAIRAAGDAGAEPMPPIVASLMSVVLGPRVLIALRVAFGASMLLFAASLAAASMLLRAGLLAQRSELALRAAIGTSKAALRVELVWRVLVAGVIALGVGVLLAWWATDLARGPLLGTMPGTRGLSLGSVGIGWLVGLLLAAVVALSAAGGLVLGRVRADWCVRGVPGVERNRRIRLDDGWVVAHAAAAATAIALAMGLADLAHRASRSPAGLDVAGVGVMTVALPWWRLADDQARWRMVSDAIDVTSAIEGVQQVAAADNAPIVGPEFLAIPVASSTAVGTSGTRAAAVARLRSATAGAIPLLGIHERWRLSESAATGLLRLYQGDFPPLPLAISVGLAEALFSEEDAALGQLVELGEQGVAGLVLAVVDDAADGPETFDRGGASVWVPMPLGWESSTWSLLVRLPSVGDEAQRAAVEQRIRAALHEVSEDAGLEPMVWLDERVRERARIYTTSAAIVQAVAAVAMGLAMLAAIARTRLAIAGWRDELRLRGAFGWTGWPIAALAASPAIVGVLVGAAVGGAATLGLAGRLLGEPASALVRVPIALPTLIVAAGGSLACLLAARSAKLDAAGLLRAS